MNKENDKTRRRFHDATFAHGAVNATGLAHSIHEHGAAMLDAGMGTDRINNDPAMGIMIARLAQLAGFTIDAEERWEKHRQLGDLLEKLGMN